MPMPGGRLLPNRHAKSQKALELSVLASNGICRHRLAANNASGAAVVSGRNSRMKMAGLQIILQPHAPTVSSGCLHTRMKKADRTSRGHRWLKCDNKRRAHRQPHLSLQAVKPQFCLSTKATDPS